MNTKLYKFIVFTALIAFFVTSLFVTLFAYGAGLPTQTDKLLYAVLLPSFLISLVTAVLLAFVIARLASNSITKPIKELDLKNPDKVKTFDELQPILDRLSYQNYEIFNKTNALSVKENEFLSLTANMSEGLVLVNSRGNAFTCNRSAREIFDFDGKLPTSILSVNSSEAFRVAVLKALSGENGYYSFCKEDKFYSLIASPVFNNGNADGAVIVVIDETEKEQREQLRREFTSNVSHELKTPLTSISGFAELISSGMAMGDDAKRFALKIGGEAARLITLVGDIIKLTQLDGGEIYLGDRINLFETSKSVVARLQNLADAAGISLSVTGEELYVTGNSTIIFELIYNLVDNGIKYTEKGGKVELRVFREKDGVAICVKDNGIGIPKDKQERVFERFYRVDKSHSKEIGGTGLGLSIVKHAANCHNAKIKLDSEAGCGTEITVTFQAESVIQ